MKEDFHEKFDISTQLNTRNYKNSSYSALQFVIKVTFCPR